MNNKLQRNVLLNNSLPETTPQIPSTFSGCELLDNNNNLDTTSFSFTIQQSETTTTSPDNMD